MNGPANAYALHDDPGRGRAQQWAASAIAIVAAHVVLIAAAFAWYQQAEPPGVEMPAIMVDLPPAPAAPAVQQQDLAPGPQMQQAPERTEPSQPEQPMQEQPAAQPQAMPVAPAPEIALPPPAHQPKQLEAAKPDTSKQAAKPRTEPKRTVIDEPKRKRAEAKLERREPPAPRTTATPRAERQAALQSAQAGRAASAAALPSYRDRLAAHLARYKQYPSGSKAAGEQGTALLSFTVGRGGQVLASRLSRSSGHPALDAETMAMIRRAQPLPPFPAEMTQSSLSFTVPVNFSLR